MLLNIVILVLQEVIEASMLIALLLSLLYTHGIKYKVILHSIIFGSIGACVYGYHISDISQWFEYTGQEVSYAGLQLLIYLSIVFFTIIFFYSKHKNIKNNSVLNQSLQWCVFFIITLAIVREGSEIYIYIVGVLSQSESLQNTLIGSSLGVGVGVCAGILLFYFLLNVPHKYMLGISVMLLAMVAGSMCSQAVVLLNQADYLPASTVVWDSSAWVSEESVLGRVLYSFVGYEATPSLSQLCAYSVAAASIILLLIVSNIKKKYAYHQ